eukprot:scaffold140474_cov48-Attheya_sp.AAC.1
MSARVGEVLGTLVDQSINVWEAIESIQADLDTTNLLLSSGKEEVAERGEQLDGTNSRLKNLGQSYTNLSESYKLHQKLVTKLNRSVKTLELKVKLAGEHQYSASGTTDGLRRGEYATESVDDLTGARASRVTPEAFNRVVEDVRALEEQVHGGDTGGSNNSGYFQSQLDQMATKLKSFGHTSTDGAVVLANHTFPTYHDLRKFVEDKEVVSCSGRHDPKETVRTRTG